MKASKFQQKVEETRKQISLLKDLLERRDFLAKQETSDGEFLDICFMIREVAPVVKRMIRSIQKDLSGSAKMNDLQELVDWFNKAFPISK